MGSYEVLTHMAFKVQGLGFGRVWQDDDAIEFARKQKELFFFLLERPAGERRDAIIAALWSDTAAEERLVARFASLLYRLRNNLGRHIVEFLGEESWQDEVYQLKVEIEFYDVRAFEAAFRTGDYKRAIELYSGQYLPEIESDWAFWRRQELEVMRQTAQEALDDV